MEKSHVIAMGCGCKTNISRPDTALWRALSLTVLKDIVM